jgi:hypothetical protein
MWMQNFWKVKRKQRISWPQVINPCRMFCIFMTALQPELLFCLYSMVTGVLGGQQKSRVFNSPLYLKQCRLTTNKQIIACTQSQTHTAERCQCNNSMQHCPSQLMAIHLVTSTYQRLSTVFTSVISGFRREVDENCALLGCYTVSRGKFLPTFRDYLSVPYSRAKNAWRPLKMEPIVSPETSVRNCHYSLCNNPEERSSHVHKFSTPVSFLTQLNPVQTFILNYLLIYLRTYLLHGAESFLRS